MKTVLVCLFAMLMSTSAMAGGKVQFTPRYKFGQNKITPMFGLSVYEKVAGPIFTNLWLGISSDSWDSRQETTYTLKNTFEVHPMSGITFGLGAEVNYQDLDALNKSSDKDWNGNVHGKVAVQLW